MGQRSRRQISTIADDILARLGNHHARGLDLIDARVGGIERARNGVEADFAFDAAVSQLAIDSVIAVDNARAPVVADGQAAADWSICPELPERCEPFAQPSKPRARFSPPLAKETRKVPSPPGP